MQAVLEKNESIDNDVADMSSDDGAHDSKLQGCLDRIITYYKENGSRPVFKLSGPPIDITKSLVTKVRETLPAHLQNDATIVLDHLIDQIVDYCREREPRELNMEFSFDGGNKGISGE